MMEEKCKSFCLNDCAFCSDEDHEYLKANLPLLFEKKSQMNHRLKYELNSASHCGITFITLKR